MTERFAATVLQIRDCMNQHIEEGRAGDFVGLDRRGLGALFAEKQGDIFLVPPDPEHTNKNGRVFLRAVF